MGTTDEQQAGEYLVFIELADDPDREGRGMLAQLGIEPQHGVSVLTAKLPLSAVQALSEMPWVEYLRLARPLRPAPS